MLRVRKRLEQKRQRRRDKIAKRFWRDVCPVFSAPSSKGAQAPGQGLGGKAPPRRFAANCLSIPLAERLRAADAKRLPAGEGQSWRKRPKARPETRGRKAVGREAAGPQGTQCRRKERSD